MRYITLWRRRDNPLEWDFYISETEREAGEVMANLGRQLIKEARTYGLGDLMPNLCIGKLPTLHIEV